MVKTLPTFEGVFLSLNTIVDAYFNTVFSTNASQPHLHEKAVTEIKALGFSEGDAVRWLSKKPTYKREKN